MRLSPVLRLPCAAALVLVLVGVLPAGASGQDGATAAGTPEAATRIAVVDVESVVARSNLGQQLQARLQAFTEATNVEGQAHLDALNAMRDSLVTGIDSLPQEELDRLQEAFTSRSAEFDTFQSTKRQEADQIRTQGFQGIEIALQPVLISVRDEMNFDLILNRTPGVVLITKPQADITEVVLLRFNQATASSTPGGSQ